MSWYKFIARFSHFSFRLLKNLTDFLDALFSGFWLGVMSGKSLDYSDELYYNRTKYYREEKYNQSGLFEWEKPLIGKFFSNAKSILLIAAGGGREMLVLSKEGFEVDGYECNPALIEFGNELLKKNKINKEIKYLKRNSVPADVTGYDGIIVGWGAYSHMEGKDARLGFLSGLKPFFMENTVLMISFIWITRKGWKDNMISNVSNFFRFFRGKFKSEPGDRLVPDFIHYFDEEEIKKELELAGFRIVDFSTKDYGCLIARL